MNVAIIEFLSCRVGPLPCSILGNDEDGFSCAFYLREKSAYLLARHETSISLQSLNCDAHPVCGPSGTLSSPLVCLVSWAVWLRVNGPSAVGKVELSAGSSGLCCASPRAGLRRMGLHAKLSHASVLGRGHGSNFISSRTRFTLGLMCVGQRGRSLNWEKIELLLSSYYVPYAELGFLHY